MAWMAEPHALPRVALNPFHQVNEIITLVFSLIHAVGLPFDRCNVSKFLVCLVLIPSCSVVFRRCDQPELDCRLRSLRVQDYRPGSWSVVWSVVWRNAVTLHSIISPKWKAGGLLVLQSMP